MEEQSDAPSELRPFCALWPLTRLRAHSDTSGCHYRVLLRLRSARSANRAYTRGRCVQHSFCLGSHRSHS
uniref:Uncharacterized protein n=1 Tax=Knipowitschia caucasica TaxID=637954 RepID=A0AAV2JJL7_KNICA